MSVSINDDRKHSSPTIADVAKAAKVSIKTVSRVLNREPNVRKTTRETIEKAMKALDYRPNSAARMLASNKTYLIGLIYHSSSSYLESIQNGVLQACAPEHYDVLIHPCNFSDPSLLGELRKFIESKRVDGLVLIPPISDSNGVQELLEECGVANIAISRKPMDENDSSVCTNDRQVCESMVEHLIDLGHKKIAFVRSHPDHKAMADRYLGYLDGMKEAGIEVKPSWIKNGDNSFESGFDCGESLLKEEDLPTAIFCSNDHMAAGVVKAIRKRGLDIPKDISIAGFDDAEIASQTWPELTTIKQPLGEMSKRATEDLIKLIRNEKPKELQVTINSKLVIRKSTGPVNSI